MGFSAESNSATITNREATEAARNAVNGGDLAAGIEMCEQLLAEDPANAEVLMICAIAHLKSGSMPLARDLAAKAHEIKPDYVKPINALADIAWMAGDLEEAYKWSKKWVELEPENLIVLSNFGACCLRLNKWEEAIPTLEEVARLSPSTPGVHNDLGSAYQGIGRLREAESEFRASLELDPHSYLALESLGLLQSSTGDTRGASDLFRRAYAEQPDSVGGRINMARSLISSNDNFAEAARLLRSALERDPANAAALSLLGFVLARIGAYTEAEQVLLSAIDYDPHAASALINYAYVKKFSGTDMSIVDRIVLGSEEPAIGAAERRALKYAAAKVHDDLGEYGRAMNFLDEAHQLDRHFLPSPFDRVEFANYVGALISYDYERFATRNPTTKPIFIIGMPRSGTTLVEQILSAHPLIAAGGELDYWSQHAPALLRGDSSGVADVARSYVHLLDSLGKEAPFVTDKMVENFLHLGIIRAILPNARFIHCRRNPLDNCLSIYLQLFSNPRVYATTKSDLVFTYKQYAGLMDHWKQTTPANQLLEVCYEDVVKDPKLVSEEMLAFCGLEWDDSCMQPEKNTREVLTASHWQVRQPIYRSSVAKWKRYEPWLGELAELVPASDRITVS